MIKIIGLDIGEKRVGVALSEDKRFAFPLKTVAAENIADEISSLAKSDGIEIIVAGLPRNMDGTLGFQADRIKAFVNEHLEKYLNIIEYIDETATSIEAENIMKREGKDPRKNPELIDAYAAKIILEDYLREKGVQEKDKNVF